MAYRAIRVHAADMLDRRVGRRCDGWEPRSRKQEKYPKVVVAEEAIIVE